jgi:hypothetical protein
MKVIAFLVLVCAWACLFMMPTGTTSRVTQLMVFGLLGAVLTLAGGFQYWWSSGMLPSQKSSFILLCGLGTLASQAGSLLRGLLGGEGGMDWPQSKPRRPWRK